MGKTALREKLLTRKAELENECAASLESVKSKNAELSALAANMQKTSSVRLDAVSSEIKQLRTLIKEAEQQLKETEEEYKVARKEYKETKASLVLAEPNAGHVIPVTP